MPTTQIIMHAMDAFGTVWEIAEYYSTRKKNMNKKVENEGHARRVLYRWTEDRVWGKEWRVGNGFGAEPPHQFYPPTERCWEVVDKEYIGCEFLLDGSLPFE